MAPFEAADLGPWSIDLECDIKLDSGEKSKFYPFRSI